MSDLFTTPPSWSTAPQMPPRLAPREPAPFALGFFEALGWCVIFVLFTQIPGAFVAVAVLLLVKVVDPMMLPEESLSDIKEVMNSPGMSVSMMAAFGFTQLLVIGFSLLVIRLLIGPDWRRQLSLRRPAFRHVLLVLAAFPAMWLLADFSYGLIKMVLPSLQDMLKVPGMEEMIALFARWPWPLALLIIGVGPGIGEELWCRGFLGRGLVGRYGVILGVIFTSFFFGLVHVDPCQGAYAMLLGLWLHYVYLTTRSLLVPMLLHFLNNSLSVLAPRWSRLQSLDNAIQQPSLAMAPLALAGLVLLLVVGWALYQSRVRQEDRADPGPGEILATSPLRPGALGAVLAGLALFGAALAWALRGLGVGQAG